MSPSPTCSRGAIPSLAPRYANVAVVEITADPEILAARLAARGRESRGEVLARLARTVRATRRDRAMSHRQQRPEGDRRRALVGIIRQALAFADVSGLCAVISRVALRMPVSPADRAVQRGFSLALHLILSR